jgi:FtsP/CotA-like multicopper oxidase with cupredoxin domain
MGTWEGETVMGIDGVPSWVADPIPVMLGETRLFAVQNDTDWAHPFHQHGFFFQAVDTAGARETPARWRDTISIPAKESRRWLVRFDERPGMWPFHCHILDHVDLGMMGMLDLMP